MEKPHSVKSKSGAAISADDRAIASTLFLDGQSKKDNFWVFGWGCGLPSTQTPST
jgi:hypothetical protein